MGNQQRTPEEDYRRYARPEPGRAGDWVEVIDDGGGRQIDADQPPGTPYVTVENPDSANAVNDGVPVPVSSGLPGQSRRNRSLWAAWALVALMLAVGTGWLFGIFEPAWNSYPPVSNPNGASGTSALSQEVQANLYTLGPFVMVFGLLGAVILLALQATMFSRGPRAD
jgi:hypothetical protein